MNVSGAEGRKSSSNVIAVDLDGTLALTDTLYESVFSLIRDKPYMLLLLPFWLVKGIAYLKYRVAEHSVLDVTTLPYNVAFIDWLKEQKVDGKQIVLCTAANERIAKSVFKHLGLFDDVIASDKYKNLKSSKKRDVLQEKYGVRGYDYAGNDTADVAVWAGAAQAIVVSANERVLAKASQVSTVSQTFPTHSPTVLDWCKALRLHQWLKNLLLFVPLMAAHQFIFFQSLASVTIAFFAFSLSASSVYIINDLLDLASDRKHPRKRTRPFASAKLPIVLGAMMVPLLIGTSIFLGNHVGSDFLGVLSLYILSTFTYSLVLKRLVLLDCLALATLYTIRIIAGATAVSLPLSFWLLAFSVFIFLSLALVKRYSELVVQGQQGETAVPGRGYVVSDAPLLQTLGVSSGLIAALVMALYIRSEEIVPLYNQPMAIWFAVPVLIFWVSWIWLKAARGEMDDDPIVFAIKDKVSLAVATVMLTLFLCAANGTAF